MTHSDVKCIALIGLPGCGKTTLGKMLAACLGYAFTDMDEEIEKAEEMTISQMFQEKGEVYFRDAETTLLQRLCKGNRLVISTGGGIVLREENRNALRNCRVLYIRRGCEAILTCARMEGRPLLSGQPDKLYSLCEARKNLYEQTADFIIENEGTPEEALPKLLEVLR